MVIEVVGRVSRGSRMDQIYLPKNRQGLAAGEYVLIVPLDREIKKEKGRQLKPYFYGIKNLESIKLRIIEEVFKMVDKTMNPENIIITGSFLEKGFRFNDIDILIIYEKKQDIKENTKTIEEKIKENLGINPHIILIDNKTMLSGSSTDPLYSLMLSKSVSLKRFIYKMKRKIDYKLLDLHLLKSKTLIDNFDILNGNEKYYLVLNLVSILLFVQDRKNKKLSKEIVNREIEKLFKIKIDYIKENLLDRKDFLRKYKKIYDKTLDMVLNGVKNE